MESPAAKRLPSNCGSGAPTAFPDGFACGIAAGPAATRDGLACALHRHDDYKRQGQQFAFIAKAGEVLAESLDFRRPGALLAIIVPEFGDWAAIDLFDEYDRLKTVAAIHADPRKMPLVKRLLGRYNHDPKVEPDIAAILRKNRTVMLREVSNELIEKAAAPDLLQVIRALAPRSAVTVPSAYARPNDRIARRILGRDASPIHRRGSTTVRGAYEAGRRSDRECAALRARAGNRGGVSACGAADLASPGRRAYASAASTSRLTIAS